MAYVFHFLSFLSWSLFAFVIDKKLNEKLKNYVFILSQCVITLCLYWSTFAGEFHFAQILIYVAAGSILVWNLRASRGLELWRFLVAHRFVFILSTIWFVLTLGARFAEWDEFNWGGYIKHVLSSSHYWNSSSAIIDSMARYYPGPTLWECFFISRANYIEQSPYLAVGLVFISTLHILVPSRLSLKSFVVALLFSLYFMFLFSSGPSTIYVDPVMGALLALILIAIYDVSQTKDIWLPLVLMSLLAITKETAYLLTWLCLFILILNLYRTKNLYKNSIISLLVFVGIISFNHFLWNRHLQNDPHLIEFGARHLLNSISNDLNHMSERTSFILGSFLQNAYQRPLSRGLSHVEFIKQIVLNGSYVFWSLFFFIVLWFYRRRYEFIWGFVLGLIAYTFVILTTWLYFFSDYEGRALASYERYLSVYFAAFAIFLVRPLLAENWLKKKHLLVVFVLLMMISAPTVTFFPVGFKSHFVADKRNLVAPIIQTIKSKAAKEAKVWFVWQHSDGLEAMIVRYEIAPVRMNSFTWSIGNVYDKNDVWTANFSDEEFLKFALDYGYIGFGFVDDNFINHYGKFFDKNPRNNSLYKKTIQHDGSVLFVEI